MNGGLLVAATLYGPAAYVFYHADAIGSVRASTNDAGATIAMVDARRDRVSSMHAETRSLETIRT